MRREGARDVRIVRAPERSGAAYFTVPERKIMKIRRSGLLVLLLALCCAPLLSCSPGSQSAQDALTRVEPAPRNVILFIGDGMGMAQVQGAALSRGLPAGDPPEPPRLSFEKFPVFGYATTQSATHFVTDSAAAGTALSCGVKTRNGVLGQTPDGQPLTNLSEHARASGRAVGVLSSVGINHATPAAFYAKVPKRGDYDIILDQFFETGLVDVAMGGGYFGKRWTPELIQSAADKAGYKVFTCANFAEMTPENTGGKKVFGYFDANDNKQLDYLSTRQPENNEPRLEDITVRALELLSRKENGFFLMVEGGAIDWACHDNNAQNALDEMDEFDLAIAATVEFLKARGELENTLIVVTADHETGGLALRGSEDDPSGAADYGWLSKGHSGIPVPVWAQGPRSAAFSGKQDNTHIARALAAAMK